MTTTILCTDGSELALRAVEAGVQLLAPADRTLLVTVLEPLDASLVTGVSGFGTGVMSPEQFEERKVTIKPLGEMSLWDGIYGVCLSHGYRHVGEIEYVRGVQGLGGLTI